MIDTVAAILWAGGCAGALVGSHVLAYRTGASRAARQAAPEPSATPAPPRPVLRVDNAHPAQEALRALNADFAAMPAYIDTLLRQIDGVTSNTEDSIALVIEEVGTIHGQAHEQIGRMHASLDGSQALTRSSERPRAVIAKLQATLDERTSQIRANFASLSELADEFNTLRPVIETISTIADKAFFLSINAAVEAARAGPAGIAFGLVADEVRALSKLTQSASKEIGTGIATFTRRMHDELDRARPQVEGSSSELDGLIRELGAIQADLAAAGQELTSMIQSMDAGHRQMADRLSTILGHVQFQDIIRQRLDQVSEAITELGDHVCDATRLAQVGQLCNMVSLEQRLLAQQSRYVMHSQRAAFSAAAGGAMLADEAPRIELF